MMRLITLFICFLMSPAVAQDILVRTGDHPSFTRIVFSIQDGVEWEIGRTDTGYGIRFDTEETINPAEFFSLIQRNRVEDIQIVDGGRAILLRLSCACFLEAYMWRSNHLVVDIKDGDQVRSVNYDPSHEKPFQFGDQNLQIKDSPHPPLLSQVRDVIQRRENSIDSPILSLDIRERKPVARNNALLDPFRDYADQERRLGELESTISGGLQRGLSQGLLEQSEDSQEVVTQKVAISNEDSANELAELLADINAALTPGLTTRTSVDTAVGTETSTNELSSNGFSCLPDDFFDIQNWGGDLPFHLQIGMLRSQITSEFDRTDPTAIEDLAKAYLYFGFGREAIDVFSIDGNKSGRRQALIAIGRIIDGDPVMFEEIKNQLSCPGPVALWSFLAQDDGPLPSEIDPASIVVAFKLLPDDLRKYIAPRLARKLNSQNLYELAENVLSIAENNGEGAANVVTASSEIAIQQGNIGAAEQILEDLVDDNPRVTADALISLISLKISNETPVLPSELTLLRTMQFESQDTEEIGRLIRAEATVLAQRQDFDALLLLIDNEDQYFDRSEIVMYHDQVLQHSLTVESNVDFLKRIFEKRIEPNNPTLQNNIAQRLIDLGFDAQANDIIAGPTIGADMEERRYLRARIAANNQDIPLVEAHLAGIVTPRAVGLIADAGGEVSNESLQELSSDMREEIDWRSGNWESISASEDTLLQSVASRLASTPIDPSQADTPLAASRSLIDDSANLRGNVSDLLDRFDLTSQ